MESVRVLLADDHPLVRMGIRSQLEKEADILIVGEAADGNQALRLARELLPDVLLIDMEMPGLSGYEVARAVKKEGLPVRILGLSAYDDKEYIQELLSNGAAGYLIKDEALDFVITAVKAVARGEQGWLSRRAASQITSLVMEQAQDEIKLTKREKQVLQAIVMGKTNQEIGLALGITEKTVEKHIVSIFSRLGVSSRVEAAVKAVQRRLI